MLVDSQVFDRVGIALIDESRRAFEHSLSQRIKLGHAEELLRSEKFNPKWAMLKQTERHPTTTNKSRQKKGVEPNKKTGSKPK